MSAQETIENLRDWIENEKYSIEHYTRKIQNAQECLEMCQASLKRYEERLAAELSQVKA